MDRGLMPTLCGVGLALGMAPFGLQAAPPFEPNGIYGFHPMIQEQELGHGSVVALAQDRVGDMWALTDRALHRLEGSHLYPIPLGSYQGWTVPMDFCVAEEGGIWVMFRHHAAYFDGTTFQEAEALGMPKGMDMGSCLVRGVGVLLGAGSHFRLFAGKASRPVDLPPGAAPFCAWAQTFRGDLLVGCRDRLLRYREGRREERRLPADFPGIPQEMVQDTAGRVWIRTDQDLVSFEGFQGPMIRHRARLGFRSDNDYSLKADRVRGVWLATTAGLQWTDGQEAATLGPEQGLPLHGGRLPFLLDHSGRLWIGGAGLRVLPSAFRTLTFGTRAGLPAVTVWSVRRGEDGVVWAGTHAGLVRQEGTRWVAHRATEAWPFLAMAPGPDGALWAAPFMAGKGPATLWRIPPGAKEPLPVQAMGWQGDFYVHALAWDAQGTLWLGTASSGLLHMTGRAGAWRLEREWLPGEPGPPGVYCVQVDSQGRVLAATDGGLYIREGGTWTSLTQADGLLTDVLFMLTPMPDGDIWVSYQEVRGLTRISRQGGAWKVVQHLGENHPLGASPITSLAATPEGQLWVGTNAGLLAWDGQRVVRLGRNRGLLSEDCSQGALSLDGREGGWVGTAMGLVHFRRLEPWVWDAPGTVHLVRVVEDSGRTREGTDSFEVPYRRAALTFHYHLPTPGGMDASGFVVRLVGWEDGWRETTQEESRYSGLRPGDYVFEVRARALDGRLGPVTMLAFQVLPPWYLRGWVLLLEVVGFGVLLAVLHRWRLLLLKRRNQLLEDQILARTQDLEEANAALKVASVTDPLTGLRNRNFLAQVLKEDEARVRRVFRRAPDLGGLANLRNEDLLFLLVDLDHFKWVNDTYGHPAGDEVLRQLAQVMRAAIREGDSLVRWGGEEFLLVARRSERRMADAIAEHLLEAIRNHPFRLPDGEVIRRTASLGWAAFPHFPEAPEVGSWEDAMALADRCLYAAKNSGRNGWVGATLQGEGRMAALVQALADPPKALAAGGLHLVSSFGEAADLRWQEAPDR